MDIKVEEKFNIQSKLYKTYMKWSKYTAVEEQHVFKISLIGLGLGLMTTGDTKAEIHLDIWGVYFSFGIGYGW